MLVPLTPLPGRSPPRSPLHHPPPTVGRQRKGSQLQQSNCHTHALLRSPTPVGRSEKAEGISKGPGGSERDKADPGDETSGQQGLMRSPPGGRPLAGVGKSLRRLREANPGGRRQQYKACVCYVHKTPRPSQCQQCERGLSNGVGPWSGEDRALTTWEEWAGRRRG